MIYGALFFWAGRAVPISVPSRTGRAPGAIRSPCRPRWALGRPRGGHPAPAGPLPLATALLQPAGRPCRASAPPQPTMPPQRLSGARSTPAAPEAAHNRLAGENRGHPRHPQTTATAPDRPKPRWDASDGPRKPLDAMAGHPDTDQTDPEPQGTPQSRSSGPIFIRHRSSQTRYQNQPSDSDKTLARNALGAWHRAGAILNFRIFCFTLATGFPYSY